jgi:hypothetical protein
MAGSSGQYAYAVWQTDQHAADSVIGVVEGITLRPLDSLLNLLWEVSQEPVQHALQQSCGGQHSQAQGVHLQQVAFDKDGAVAMQDNTLFTFCS